MGTYRSRTDIQRIKTAAQLAGETCDTLIEAAKPGVKLPELEALANQILARNRSTAPFKLYDGFNHAICVSLNAEIVNGPSSRDITLKEGDLVSIAIGTCVQGMHGKAARTTYLGSPSTEITRLMQGTAQAITAVQAAGQEAQQISDLVRVIEATAKASDLRVIQGLSGSGIGKRLHEDPWVPNFLQDVHHDAPVSPGLIITLMPMFTLGDNNASITSEDGWTLLTEDGALSAHYADVLYLGENGFENLSRD